MKIWKVGQRAPFDLSEAGKLLQQGEVIAFPTETVYGLGGNAFSDEAVEKIFQAKGRPSDNPLIVHVAQQKQIEAWVTNIPICAQKLINHFWPGPLTLVFPVAPGVFSVRVTAGLSTVGLRMPDHRVALALIEQAGVPLAAPSANRSGRPSPTRAEHVLEDLEGKIAGMVDGGPTQVGVESTVVDVTGEIPVILRPGSITAESIRRLVGDVLIDQGLTKASDVPRSPGMKYTHYAPTGEMWLVHGEPHRRIEVIRRLAAQAELSGEKVGILTVGEHADSYNIGEVISLGSSKDVAALNRNVYSCLREFDHRQVTQIYAEALSEKGAGFALMNRLKKAAGGRILDAN